MSSLSTTTNTTVRARTHPGEILREDFMIPLAISASSLARALHVPPNRITQIITQTAPRAVTPDTALRLARCFGTSAKFWLNLQQAYDLSMAEQAGGQKIAEEVRVLRGETHLD